MVVRLNAEDTSRIRAVSARTDRMRAVSVGLGAAIIAVILGLGAAEFDAPALAFSILALLCALAGWRGVSASTIALGIAGGLLLGMLTLSSTPGLWPFVVIPWVLIALLGWAFGAGIHRVVSALRHERKPLAGESGSG